MEAGHTTLHEAQSFFPTACSLHVTHLNPASKLKTSSINATTAKSWVFFVWGGIWSGKTQAINPNVAPNISQDSAGWRYPGRRYQSATVFGAKVSAFDPSLIYEKCECATGGI